MPALAASRTQLEDELSVESELEEELSFPFLEDELEEELFFLFLCGVLLAAAFCGVTWQTVILCEPS